VGAGDAFAAGFLAATIWGWSATERLRLGHFLAARVIAVTADIGPSLSAEDLAWIASTFRQSVPQLIGEDRQ
jgi:2-dehydro-3-deoxygluconokinase